MKDNKQTRKDTSYSPASEAETQAKQRESRPANVDPAVADKITVLPGTGGPDDPGDIDFDEDDLELRPRGESEPPD